MSKDLEIYTLEEIAQLLQVTRRTIYTWVKDGKLKAFKVGRGWRVTREELDTFLNSRNK